MSMQDIQKKVHLLNNMGFLVLSIMLINDKAGEARMPGDLTL